MNSPEYENDAEYESGFTWSELPPMPVFGSKDSEDPEEDGNGEKHFLSRKARRILLSTSAAVLEVCVLAGVIGGVYLWQQKDSKVPVQEPENIIYSSDDIVMMLVKNRDKWILEKPDEGYTSCCFLDMDFDGSPELLSVAYDTETLETEARIYRVRSCTLDEAEIAFPDESGFFDVLQQLSLCYHPDTKEMLYISSDMRISESYEGVLIGSFFIHENQVMERYYFRETAEDERVTYEIFDQEQKPYEVPQSEFTDTVSRFSGRLTDLRLRYEWVQNGGDLSGLSNQKLAALLLRSYDSFSYDTSGLALQ